MFFFFKAIHVTVIAQNGTFFVIYMKMLLVCCGAMKMVVVMEKSVNKLN